MACDLFLWGHHFCILYKNDHWQGSGLSEACRSFKKGQEQGEEGSGFFANRIIRPDNSIPNSYVQMN
jgi:hypothetical protein